MRNLCDEEIRMKDKGVARVPVSDRKMYNCSGRLSGYGRAKDHTSFQIKI